MASVHATLKSDKKFHLTYGICKHLCPALTQVLLSHHNFLMRQAQLLLACTQDCQPDDYERLQVSVQGASRTMRRCSSF